MAKLTAVKVKAITEAGMYGDGGTLFFCVAPGGSKSWIQRITINGKRHDMGLGGWPLTSLAEAREQAFENRKLARSGGDPLALKRRPDVPRFREAVEKVIAFHEPTWKDGGKTAKLWRATLRDYALPKIGHKRVSDITSADVLSVVSAIWNTKHETARKVKRRIGTVLKWAVVQGYRADNPVDALSAALPKADNRKGHFRTIHHSNVTEAVTVVRKSGANPSTVLAYEFLTLTAYRSSEVRLATWEEVNLDTRTWTIPGARMKAAREYRVPLSSRALAILNEAKVRFGESGLIFPASGCRSPPRTYYGIPAQSADRVGVRLPCPSSGPTTRSTASSVRLHGGCFFGVLVSDDPRQKVRAFGSSPKPRVEKALARATRGEWPHAVAGRWQPAFHDGVVPAAFADEHLWRETRP